MRCDNTNSSNPDHFDYFRSVDFYHNYGLLMIKFGTLEYALAQVCAINAASKYISGDISCNENERFLQFKENFKKFSSRTMGALISEFKKINQSDVDRDHLDAMLEIRNYFIHDFLKSDIRYSSTEKGRKFLIAKISNVTEDLEKTIEKMTRLLESMIVSFNGSDEFKRYEEDHRRRTADEVDEAIERRTAHLMWERPA